MYVEDISWETPGMNAMGIACKEGKLDVVELLHEHGFDLNKKNRNGLTGYDYACAFEHEKVVEWFENQGIKKDMKISDIGKVRRLFFV